MINILDCVQKYKNEGLQEIYANAKVAQDIILTYLFKSKYRNNLTIKGGIVMYNITNDIRRATIDIDIDLIRIYLADDNLCNIFTSHKLSGIDIIIDKNNITDLKQQDYKGKRTPILIKDNYGNEIVTKIDMGVHTEYSIEQSEMCFNSCIENNEIILLVNSKEQIFVEKIIPIIKFGLLSTRYKDFFDLYWLIINGNLDKEKINLVLEDRIFNYGINGINNLENLIEVVTRILSNSKFIEKINNRKNNWLEISNDELKLVIVSYLNELSKITV